MEVTSAATLNGVNFVGNVVAQAGVTLAATRLSTAGLDHLIGSVTWRAATRSAGAALHSARRPRPVVPTLPVGDARPHRSADARGVRVLRGDRRWPTATTSHTARSSAPRRESGLPTTADRRTRVRLVVHDDGEERGIDRQSSPSYWMKQIPEFIEEEIHPRPRGEIISASAPANSRQHLLGLVSPPVMRESRSSVRASRFSLELNSDRRGRPPAVRCARACMRGSDQKRPRRSAAGAASGASARTALSSASSRARWRGERAGRQGTIPDEVLGAKGAHHRSLPAVKAPTAEPPGPHVHNAVAGSPWLNGTSCAQTRPTLREAGVSRQASTFERAHFSNRHRSMKRRSSLTQPVIGSTTRHANIGLVASWGCILYNSKPPRPADIRDPGSDQALQ